MIASMGVMIEKISSIFIDKNNRRLITPNRLTKSNYNE